MAMTATANRLEKSLLAAPDAVPILPAETVKNWGKTLVIAPHPDDESLGCGGAIRLLSEFDCPVEIVVMSDGTLSHPNSQQFPAPALRDLRESEMLAALAHLGVSHDKVRFLRYKDRSVPNAKSENFNNAVAFLADILREIAPASVLLPWRRDPHPDHLAANQIATAAAQKLNRKIKFIEYPIWLWELAEGADAPTVSDNVRAFRIDVSSVIEQKQRAIHAHQSQVSDLIADDPAGFRLTPEILQHFAHDWEIYLESAA